ncbi:hypothetical protein [Thermoleptolyngbya sp. C42_A2020_037]|uniref:hypothetical protein n=1 Tax=Thermoleptolyngbya sp. C42_A2020_037 TaxID=2747799 RepID=UPI0019FC05B7|nr:hypothetical protein [Thermoleptolyngbya sp. C42_A2020_037]MBF2084529.1 hypothetical protein [Thermoleptolyngbya sp. C42_A2020_037]
MSFQFNQIDRIKDFDKAIEALESEYLPGLVEAFGNSPEGQAYLNSQPAEEAYLGDWVGNFVYFGYSYLNVTLPKMQKRDAEVILQQLFPSKIALSEPDDANRIVPELTPSGSLCSGNTNSATAAKS